ncbi:NYN domain-containing protein [Erwinia sp. JH02]|uniref:NYN domain-containing protein n=1 Tax=Erwinia sp. JH02 TaxID=2733394 RepID=UPI00148A0927|nr:NYN domain-containing protein [Erwinia sp. JH02]NNS07076.1 NYN domain-containing protein [Erwinia sp. JH02]
MKITVCIDYDNLSLLQKNAGIFDVVQRIFTQSSYLFDENAGECEIRLYGGWYEGDTLSIVSQQVSVSIQREFPAVMRVLTEAGQVAVIKVTAELAVSLLEEPGHHLFNTYRRKGRPSNIRVETPSSVGCNSNDCPLPLVKKVLQKGRCPALGCVSQSNSIVYRHEQKLVDTMLTCDLIYLSGQNNDYLFIVSADDDFLPPIRTLMLKGKKIIRVHPQMRNSPPPIKIGAKTLIELGI